MFGQNVCNTSSPLFAGVISKDNVGKLKPKWVFDAAGDVSATPAVVGGFVYVPDWGGMINKINAATGIAVWSKNVGDLLTQAGDAGSSLTGFVSRTTPLVTGGVVIFGTMRQAANLTSTLGPGAFLVAIDQTTGAFKWSTLLDPHPAAAITGSPVLEGTRLYIGVSWFEEVFGTEVPNYTCCSFRGSEVAVDVATGNIACRRTRSATPSTTRAPQSRRPARTIEDRRGDRTAAQARAPLCRAMPAAPSGAARPSSTASASRST
jgi:polyvinyl alcohol dehydrogenase (cytochrome)